MHQDGRDGVARTLFRAGRDPPRRQPSAKPCFLAFFSSGAVFLHRAFFFEKKERNQTARTVPHNGRWPVGLLFSLFFDSRRCTKAGARAWQVPSLFGTGRGPLRRVIFFIMRGPAKFPSFDN